MKRLFVLATLSLLCLPACAGMLQSTAQIVDPVGPMMISVPAGTVEQTTTTFQNNGIYIEGSASDGETGVNQTMQASERGITGDAQAGSLLVTAKFLQRVCQQQLSIRKRAKRFQFQSVCPA